MKQQELAVHDANKKMISQDFNVFELEMSRERVHDLENQLDAIMSGEYNARNVIDKQLK